jgi:hypothetical protein
MLRAWALPPPPPKTTNTAPEATARRSLLPARSENSASAHDARQPAPFHNRYAFRKLHGETVQPGAWEKISLASGSGFHSRCGRRARGGSPQGPRRDARNRVSCRRPRSQNNSLHDRARIVADRKVSAPFWWQSARTCHEGCFRLQPQELLSLVPPQCRIPLAREPSALGPRRLIASPCRGRDTGGRCGSHPSAARCTKDNSVLWPERLSRLSRSLLVAGCPDPAPPPATQCSRQALLHPSRQPLTPLLLCLVRRARKAKQPLRPPGIVAAFLCLWLHLCRYGTPC